MTGDVINQAWREQVESLAAAHQVQKDRCEQSLSDQYQKVDKRTKEMVRATHQKTADHFSQVMKESLKKHALEEERMARHWNERCQQATHENLKELAASLAEIILGRRTVND